MGRGPSIEARKNAEDARRGKIFTKIIREISVAARRGGGDPNGNPGLRSAVDKALSANMSKDVIERAIKKATGALEGVDYEEIRYEGYASGGVAVIVDCLTDNKVRTVADVRHAFGKFGGNLGTDGSVSFMFAKRGVLWFAAGAEDIVGHDDGSSEVITAPHDLVKVRQALTGAGLKSDFAEVTMKPTVEVECKGEDGIRMQKLLDALEALDDVQDVYTTAVIVE